LGNGVHLPGLLTASCIHFLDTIKYLVVLENHPYQLHQ
jgi:hypothetical protein